MDCFKIENLSFMYPEREEKALSDINVTIKKGEFVTLCGQSGCGKTTLLRLLKPILSPNGKTSGSIIFEGKPLSDYDTKEQAAKIGFVMQNPDNGIVTDKVWHELAFGLESLGMESSEIRTRVSEMASYFGIQTWFHKSVDELSGGQKQMLNLASVMVMQPSVLILDEPVSQLDPIAGSEFFATVKKINSELGTTVILTEHRLEDVFPMSDRVIVMDSGKIIVNDTPSKVGEILKKNNHEMYRALPVPMRVSVEIQNDSTCPLTVREGRTMLEEFAETHTLYPEMIPRSKNDTTDKEIVVQLKDVWFRYDRNLPDVVKGLSLNVHRSELYAIVGGNGTGKSTALSLISGMNKPYRGEVFINGNKITVMKDLYNGLVATMPQNPQSLFIKKTLHLDLLDMLSEKKISPEEKDTFVYKVSSLCRLSGLLESHPYDLSGGEQQRAALAKVLLLNPQILILDEPTKGMDAKFKEEFAEILLQLKKKDVTIIMVSHDIEFCAAYADRCAMFFDGSITSEGVPREFFKGKNFYTTSANRMSRTLLPTAILTEDVISACTGKIVTKDIPQISIDISSSGGSESVKKESCEQLSKKRIFAGIGFVILFALCIIFHLFSKDGQSDKFTDILRIISVISTAGLLMCLFPQKKYKITSIQTSERKLSKKTVLASFLILLMIPLTIYIGIYHFGDRKYYLISLLIILETMIPFIMVFEGRKPKARELVTISALCAIAVAGRAAFFMIPQFKPVIALIIIAGICLGSETGFLIGSMTGFVSNFFFGQGPWTPWQMFAFGIIGFLSGILFKKGFLSRNRISLCIFGFIATLVFYGGLMNASYVIQAQINPTFEMFAAAYISGMPFDLIHAFSTAVFLWFISHTMIEKIERVIIKYGILME